MNTAISEILFAAEEVAAVIGEKAYDLQKLHTADFGVPGHWRINRQGGVIYTVKGINALVDSLVRDGRIHAAALLHTELMKQQQALDTPSRSPAVPARKSHEPYYRTHPTLA